MERIEYDTPPKDNEFDFRAEMLKAHRNDYTFGFNDDHIMAKLDNDNISEFHVQMELNARIFQKQILKCIELCNTKEEVDIVKMNADKAYKYFFDELVNRARVARNKDGNFIVKELLGNATKEKVMNEITKSHLAIEENKDGNINENQ